MTAPNVHGDASRPGSRHTKRQRSVVGAGVSTAMPESFMAEGGSLRPKAGQTFRVPTASAVREGSRALECELLRVEEAARVLGVGRSKAFEMLRAGELPVVRMGRSVRIPRRALAAWIEARTEMPTGRMRWAA